MFAWIRRGGEGDANCVVICNFTPIDREGVVIGLPEAGHWDEVLNTDAETYGGGNRGNLGGVDATGPSAHGQAQSATITLPPLSTIILRHTKT